MNETLCTNCKHILPGIALEYSRCGASRENYLSNKKESFRFCSFINIKGNCDMFDSRLKGECPEPPPGPLKKLWDILRGESK